MTTFVTRVELHGVYHDHAIYDDLHKYMATEGFVRYITTAAGKHLWLPTATYVLNTTELLSQVEERANRAATKTKYSFWALTIQTNGWLGRNLPEAK